MFARRTARLSGLLLVVLGVFTAVVTLQAQGGKILATHTLPDLPLGDFLQQQLGIVVDDHHINLGGIGSDLWHDSNDGPGIYWMITDRGPNGLLGAIRTFPIPEFTPFLLQVRTLNGTIEILESVAIKGLGKTLAGVTGVSNTSRDEVPYDCAGTKMLSFNAHGLDTEGLVHTSDGTFWLVEEYSPSIVRVGRDGYVQKRYLPMGLTPPDVTPGYVSVEVLPSIFGAKRKRNRGFEGVAISPNRKLLYIVLQSPLSNPNSAIGNASRNTRILVFNVETETVVGEYVYRFQPVTDFGLSDPAEMKVSALSMLDENRILVLERTDQVARVYRVDLRQATNILGSQWDAVATAPSLEALDETQLATNKIDVLPKQFVIEMDSAKGYPPKIEGLAILSDQSIAISNDNDFGVGTFTVNTQGCFLDDTRNKSRVVVIRLDQPLTAN